MLLNKHQIRSRIYTIREKHVMIDRDLALLYGVETRILNQAVKRNIERFPERFMIQLNQEEMEDWKSQIVISKKEIMGLRKPPYAFTEQGVSMLSAVLRSKTAVGISIQIIDAFVAMRKFILANAQLFQRLNEVERKQLEHEIKTDKKFEQVFSAIEDKDIKPKQGIFFDGQIFDAYKFIADLIRKAKKSIVLIDNYVDDSVLTLFTKRKKNVSVKILTKLVSKQLALDLKKHNEQYSEIIIQEFKDAHDRFIILDDRDVYHIGASLKDLGKKWFAFSKFDKQSFQIIEKLKKGSN